MEGYDQLRAWFNESLMIGMATRGIPPYREVVAHGFTVDENGHKMSKSKGNVIDPMKLMETYGADILRWMAMSFDYWQDMRISKDLKQYAEQYRDIRNRFRFMLGNLADFDPEAHRVPVERLDELDRWILHRLQGLIGRVSAAYDSYQYHLVTRDVYQFLSGDVSAFYLDVVKDRLYTSLPDDPIRRSAQTAMYDLTRSLAIVLSPLLSHTTEEVWSHLPGAREELCSVHLCNFPRVRASLVDEQLAAAWEPLFEVRREAQRVLDTARREGVLKQSRETQLEITCPAGVAGALERFGASLPGLFIVSDVTVRIDNSSDRVSITVHQAAGSKCERCWNVLPTVGKDAEYPELCSRCSNIVRHWPAG